jgi:ATP-binding protein involved in chromosome partitioning
VTGPLDFDALASRKKLESIGNVVLVGSGKGGVGKTLVTCGLALSLARRGLRTAIFDMDVHGASVPSYLGVKPPVRSSADGLEPKRKEGVAVMSLALFTGENPIPVRGQSKQGLLTQLFSLTNWGELDYLVVDLPPGTGDELLASLSLFGHKSRMILVTTPSKDALGVVARLGRLARAEKLSVAGAVINMAYVRGRSGKTFPFGRPDKTKISRALGAPIVAELPLDPDVSSKGISKVLASDTGISQGILSLSRLVMKGHDRRAGVPKRGNRRSR